MGELINAYKGLVEISEGELLEGILKCMLAKHGTKILAGCAVRPSGSLYLIYSENLAIMWSMLRAY
jgi:hypothetical protein